MKEQAHLHEEFDNHLASGTLDHRMNEFIDSKVVISISIRKIALYGSISLFGNFLVPIFCRMTLCIKL
jgi:hypothetical protein